MVTSECEICGKEITRAGNVSGRFCSKEHMAIWQRSQKPVTREWLYGKYVMEGMGTTQIARLVNRHPKRVYEWLIDWDIPTREKWQGNVAQYRPWRDKELLVEMYDRPMTIRQIADELGCQYGTAWRWMHKLGVNPRTGAQTCSLLGRNVGIQNGMYGITGADHPNWKGGCTPERQALYSSMAWAEAVKTIWNRDKATCQRCGKYAEGKGGNDFCIHHKACFSDYPNLRLETSNLILLCMDCHHWVHSKANVEREFLK